LRKPLIAAVPKICGPLSRYLAEGVYADLAQEYMSEIARAETELANIENKAKSSR
jgi:hypothetical protein